MAAPSRKILIAMDGSRCADYAFDWYKKYFYKDRDDVLILFCAEHGRLVSQPIPSTDPMLVAKLAHEEEGDIKVLIETFHKLIQTSGIKGSVLRLSATKPGEAIVKAAEENQVDIIVTGTRGQGTVRRTLLGSVSQYVVHHAKVPVLVVRQPPQH